MKKFILIKNNKVVNVLIVDESNFEEVKDSCMEMNQADSWVLENIDSLIGINWVKINDTFYPEKPFESWNLDQDGAWEAPVPYPKDGRFYIWDESMLKWISHQPEGTDANENNIH